MTSLRERAMKTGNDQERRGAELGRVLLVAFIATLALQLIRVFLPMVFDLGERSGTTSAAIRAGEMALLVSLAPIVAPVVTRLLGPRPSLVASVVALAALRIAVQVIHPVPLELATAGMAVSLLALTLLLVAAGARSDFVPGLLMGLAIDTGLHSAFWSWDYAWQTGAVPFVLAVVPAAGAVLLLLGRPGEDLAARGHVGGSPPAALVGPFLFLHVLFVQNIAFVSSSGHVSLPVAAALVLVADALALALATRGGARLATRVVAGVAMIVLAYLLRSASGGSVIVAAIAGNVLSAWLLASAFGRASASRPGFTRRTSVAFASGSLAFTLLLVLYQIGYRVSLPFPNKVLAPVAAFVLALGARRPASLRQIAWGRRIVLAGVPALLLFIPLGMAVARPGATMVTGDGRSLRLMSCNVHLAIDQAGQLDPSEVARVIRRENPDVVALQEVVRGWAGAGGLDLAEWLSRELRMDYVYSPAADDQFGNVILSRLPIRDSRAVFLPKDKAAMRRSYALAIIDLGSAEEVTLIDAHMEGGKEDHKAQTEAILQELGTGSSGTLIAGDLNMQPDNPDATSFEAAGLASVQDLAGQGDASTATRPKFPGDRVDWIFGTADLAFSEFRIGDLSTSDHRPLIVTVSLA
jgi:endonuclease/exonuclease/phosphatase family metal-dependent hydrolase